MFIQGEIYLLFLTGAYYAKLFVSVNQNFTYSITYICNLHLWIIR